MRQRTKNYPSKKLMVSEGEGGGEWRRMRGKRWGREIDLTYYQLLPNCVFVLVQCTNSGFVFWKLPLSQNYFYPSV